MAAKAGKKKQKQALSDDNCGKCEGKVRSGDKAVRCDICLIWYHTECGHISEELFEVIEKFAQKGQEEIPWQCRGCRKYAAGIVSGMIGMKKRQDRLEENITELREQRFPSRKQGDDSDQPILAAESDEKQFLGLMEKASRSIQGIKSNVSSIERSICQIGTPSDNANLRNGITSVVQEVYQFVSSIEQLQELGRNLNKEHLLRVERISDQFMVTVQRVSAIQKQVAKQMSSSLDQPKPPSFNSTDVHTQPEEEEEVGFSLEMKQCDAAEYELNLLEERLRQLRDVVERIVDVNEISHDMDTLVMEQSDVIDPIDYNVERARVQLQEAMSCQRKRKASYKGKQMCILQ